MIVSLSFVMPMKDGKLTSTYGESRGDHFHDGIDFISGDHKIYAIDDATLQFMWDKTLYPLENEPGGGNYKILLLKNNISSILLHLQDGVSQKRIYKKGDFTDITGNTGHSFARHLHMALMNFKKRESLNPMNFIPKYEDTKAPEIQAMWFRIFDKHVKIRDKATVRLTKHRPLLLEIRDRAVKKERLGIYSLTVSHNNKEILSIIFNKINQKKQALCQKKPYEDVFDSKGFYKIKNITYVNGRNDFDIKARDFSGNLSQKTFSLIVNLDIK